MLNAKKSDEKEEKRADKLKQSNDLHETNESNDLHETIDTNKPNESNKSNESNKPNESNKSNDSNDSNDLNDSKKMENWLQPPEKWVEARRILSELNEKSSSSEKPCVLLSVLNMKVLMELHNFLLSPSFYCLLSMRRVLNRAFDEKTLSSREAKLLAEVRRRLDGKLESNWRENWITFQRITEIESERNNYVELPRIFFPFSLPHSHFPKSSCFSLLCCFVRLLSQSIRSFKAQHCNHCGRQFGSNPSSRSRRFLVDCFPVFQLQNERFCAATPLFLLPRRL